MRKRANDRIKRVKSKLARAGMDALLITDRHNINYLTGFYISGAMMLVTKRDDPFYFVDPMNRALADKMLKGENLYIVTAIGSAARTLAGFVRDKKIKKLGFNSKDLSVSIYKRLSASLPKVRLLSEAKREPVFSVLEGMRKIKSPEEIRILRKAAKKTARIWREAGSEIKTGMSEREIATVIDLKVRSEGCQNSFPTIAAIGENSAYPHAVPMGRRLKKGEHLVVDFGIILDGYCSDLTRIWVNGRIGRKITLMHKHVRVVHDRTIKEIRPGVAIGALVRKANSYFKDNDLAQYICHGLGHGIGLDIHEAPFLRKDSSKKLKEGMVITVEPGLYDPAVGGVRQEDMVLVTKTGSEVLTI